MTGVGAQEIKFSAVVLIETCVWWLPLALHVFADLLAAFAFEQVLIEVFKWSGRASEKRRTITAVPLTGIQNGAVFIASSSVYRRIHQGASAFC